jgi:hypothetical protein
MRSASVDPHIDYRRLRELSNEFLQHWKRLQAFYLDAAAGFAFVRGQVESNQARSRSYLAGTELDSEEFQDTRVFTYANIFAGGFATSGIHEATLGEAKARNAPDGSNFTTLGQLCIISFYDFWNDYLRREYVIAKGQLHRGEQDQSVIECSIRKHASHDLWGDIRLLRQSIVHNQGIATSDIKRCKIIKWFKTGDRISITPERMRTIFLALRMYYNKLFKEQFPIQHFRIREY